MPAIVRVETFDQARLALIRFGRGRGPSARREFMEAHALQAGVEQKLGAGVNHDECNFTQ
jgi:hypothetical protein